MLLIRGCTQEESEGKYKGEDQRFSPGEVDHQNSRSLRVAQTVSVLFETEPSLFSIRAWFRACSLGRTCGCLGRMIIEDHVFI
jgi:hypothetical protein